MTPPASRGISSTIREELVKIIAETLWPHIPVSYVQIQMPYWREINLMVPSGTRASTAGMLVQVGKACERWQIILPREVCEKLRAQFDALLEGR